MRDTVFVLATKEHGAIWGNYFYHSMEEAQAALDNLPEATRKYLRPYGFREAGV